MGSDIVRYVGDIVAVVVAETPYQAADALELIEVDYEPLPAVTDAQAAAKPGAPQLHPGVAGNEAFHWTVAGGDIDAAFANAEIVVKERIVQQRLIPNAMEPRAALAQWSGGVRRADAVEHDAESAHPAFPVLGRHRASRKTSSA